MGKKLDSISAWISLRDKLLGSGTILKNSHMDGQFDDELLEIHWAGWLKIPADRYPEMEALISRFASDVKDLRDGSDEQNVEKKNDEDHTD